MWSVLTGLGSRGVNTSSISISGLPAANRLQEEATNHEKRGNIDKAKECFETKICKAEETLQRSFKKSEISKTRELLAASHFYYGNFLYKCGDEFNARDNYKKALDHGSHMDLEQPGALDLYNQIAIQYGSFLAKDEKVSQGNINLPDLTETSFQPQPVALFTQRKSELVDYLFKKALSTLGSLEVPSKPSLFLVYAHDNPAYGQADADTSKYLIEKLSQIRVNLYSDQTPMGQPHSRTLEDLKEDGKLEDILTSQLCLLPARLRADVEPVHKVVVCCSEVLEKYLRWPHYEKFYQELAKAYREDCGQVGSSALREVVRKFSQEEDYKAGFHHVLTEMAFLQIRAEHLKDKHGIIPVSLTPESAKHCLGHIILPTTVRLEDIPRFEEQAQAGQEVYPNQSRHWVLFKLIERLLVGSNEAKTFLNKFWQGYSECISRLKNESMLGELEFVKLVDHIFDEIEIALHKQLATTVQQVYPALQKVDTHLLDQSRNLTHIQTGVDSVVKRLLGNLQENILKLRATYLEGLEQDIVIKDALANYVPPEGMLIHDSTRFDLKGKVQDFLNSDKKALLLLGDAGSGKSTFNRHLAVSLWEAYIQVNAVKDAPIPVFITLSSLPGSNQNLVSSFFEAQGFSKEHIKELQTNYRFVLILDGFDEIEQRHRAFYKDNQLNDWKDAKIIISSRPEYLGSNYQYKFHPSSERTALQEYRLASFSSMAIEQYVDQYKKAYPEGSWSATQYKAALKQPDVKELVGNPFLLKITLSVLPELSETLQIKGERLTRIALYDQFVKSWFNRSQQRLAQIQLNPEETKEFRRLDQRFAEYGVGFSKKLAAEMYKAGAVTVAYSATVDDPWEEPSAKSSEDWRKRFLGDDNAMTVLMRLNAPLICQGNQYRFIHRSLRDYFVARGMWEELCADEPKLKQLEIKQSTWFNRLNIVKDPAVLQFLSERVHQKTELKNQLLRVIERTKVEAEFVIGGANAMTILVKAGVQFNGADLNGIQIPGADLSFGVFDSAQLQGADLRNVNLRTSWLRQANLSGAQMAGVQFGEWPYLPEVGSVFSCAYSPDGTKCAIGLENHTINVYSTLDWKKTQILKGHKARIWSVAYSPNGEQIASGSFDKTVQLWDMQSNSLGHTLQGHTSGVSSVVYSPSGEEIAAGGLDKTVRLWDAQSGTLQHTLEGHDDCVWSVAYSPNGDQIASGSFDKTVRLWDAQSGASVRTLQGHKDRVFSVVYSPNGDQIASGSDDWSVRLWDAQSGAPVRTLDRHTGPVWSVVYSPSGDQIASGSLDKTVRLWDAQSGVPGQILVGHTAGVFSVVYSPSGDQIASSGEDKTVRLWDAQSSVPVYTIQGHMSGVMSIAYSPSGNQIASGGNDAVVQLWDAQSGAPGHTLRGHLTSVSSVVYSPSGDQIFSGGLDKTVRLWDAQSGTLCHTLDLKVHDDCVWRVACSPNGDQIASCGNDSAVRLWDAQSGASVHTLQGHKSRVWSVVYSPNGEQIVSGSGDKTLRLWDAQNGVAIRTLEGHTAGVFSVAYSPNGNQIASGSSDYTVRLWDAQSGATIYTLQGHTSGVFSVVYSPSGDQIASGSLDSTVRLWETQMAQCKLTIEDCGAVRSLAWKETSGSHYLAIGSFDKSVRQWEVKTDGEGYKAVFCWSSGHDFLIVRGALLDGVIGLSEVNAKLLKQRGAVAEFFEEESDDFRSKVSIFCAPQNRLFMIANVVYGES